MPIGLTQQLRSAVPSSIHSTSSGGTLPPQCRHLVDNLRIALGSAPPRSGLVALKHCAEPRSQFICLRLPGLARAIRPRNRFLRDPGFSSAASETGSKALPAQGIPPLGSLSGKRSGSGCQREEQRGPGQTGLECALGEVPKNLGGVFILSLIHQAMRCCQPPSWPFPEGNSHNPGIGTPMPLRATSGGLLSLPAPPRTLHHPALKPLPLRPPPSVLRFQVQSRGEQR